MAIKTFRIKYTVHFTDGSFNVKEIKVKRCLSEMEAKVKLNKYLIKQNKNFKSLVVNSCVEDILSKFEDMFGTGTSNPFANNLSKT